MSPGICVTHPVWPNASSTCAEHRRTRRGGRRGKDERSLHAMHLISTGSPAVTISGMLMDPTCLPVAMKKALATRVISQQSGVAL